MACVVDADIPDTDTSDTEAMRIYADICGYTRYRYIRCREIPHTHTTDTAVTSDTNARLLTCMIDVIAATKLLGPGESETISFTAPEPGDYQFVCSFPGHFAMMRGIMVVK